MDSLAAFRTDKEKVATGVWIQVPKAGNFRIKVARMNNPAYEAFVREKTGGRLLRKLASDGPQSQQAQDTLRAVTREAVARHVLVGWENMELQGKPVAYSPEQALAIFDLAPDFLDFVMEEANNIENFRAETLDALAKN